MYSSFNETIMYNWKSLWTFWFEIIFIRQPTSKEKYTELFANRSETKKKKCRTVFNTIARRRCDFLFPMIRRSVCGERAHAYPFRGVRGGGGGTLTRPSAPCAEIPESSVLVPAFSTRPPKSYRFENDREARVQFGHPVQNAFSFRKKSKTRANKISSSSRRHYSGEGSRYFCTIIISQQIRIYCVTRF